MALRFIHYVRVNLLNKDNFTAGEPTISLHELLDKDGDSENDVIVELDEEYEGSTHILYKWDIQNRRWQMLN